MPRQHYISSYILLYLACAWDRDSRWHIYAKLYPITGCQRKANEPKGTLYSMKKWENQAGLESRCASGGGQNTSLRTLR